MSLDFRPSTFQSIIDWICELLYICLHFKEEIKEKSYKNYEKEQIYKNAKVRQNN